MKFPREKGRRLELKVAQLIREILEIKANRSPYSGASDFESADIFSPKLGWHIECKNQEKLQVWKWWQKVRNYKNPVLVVSGNNRPILAILNFEDFLKIIKKQKTA